MNSQNNSFFFKLLKFKLLKFPHRLQVILVFSILNNEHMLGEEYTYPDWAIPLGWILTGSSVICIPLYMIYKFDRTRGGFKRVRSRTLKCYR